MIEQASLEDISFFLSSAKAEGWNPGLSDALPFYTTDPKGFFIEKVDGKTMGCISAVAYDDRYGFMGFYIVQPEFRNKGYGIKLWKRALDYLDSRVLGLDGVVEQQDNYKKSGFKLHYKNIRFKGIVRGVKNPDLKSVRDIPFDKLKQFDLSVCGYDRSSFLKAWIQMPNSLGVAKVDNHTLKGFGLIRKCATGYKIGPLFADDPETAETLFLALADESHGEELFLDVVQPHKDALKMAQKYHLDKVFETARMYKGDPPTQDLSKIYGVTTFELG